MADLLNFAGVRVLDSNAANGAGYVARFYQTGTTSPITVYTSSDLGTAHGTSVTADSQGRFAAVWSDGAVEVKCVIEDATGAVVQTIDPVFAAASSASGASDIPFTPTVALPFTNVQDAIEGAGDLASASSGYDVFGVGITGNATALANLDATNIGAGTYRFTASTTGTFPTGVAAADTGLVETWRQAAGTAMMMLYHATTDRVFHRRMASSTWGTWREVITSNQAPVEGDVLYRGASAWTRLAKGTAGQVLRMNSGVTAPEWGAPSLTTVGLLTTTGATTVGPWDIPAGTKAFRITSRLSSLSGTDHILVQLRVGGSFVTTGYVGGSLAGTSGNITSTSGMIVYMGVASSFWDGSMDFTLHDPATNLWLSTHEGRSTTSPDVVRGSSGIALAGAVDGVRITVTGSNTFDVSSFNVHILG